MCGIFFSSSKVTAQLPSKFIADALKARGPDAYRSITISIDEPECSHVLTFYSSVLALRGDDIQEQPLVDRETGSVLCWNGEAWKNDGDQVTGNDSVLVFNLLLSVAASRSPSSSITQLLTNIAGPFAFVFYDGVSSTVYYGRDRLGRRSLVCQQGPSGALILCSVSDPVLSAAEEVSTECIYKVSFRAEYLDIKSLPWPSPLPVINTSLPELNTFTTPLAETIDLLSAALSSSLALRILDIPDHINSEKPADIAKLAILFSGGLDCTLLARLIHDILPIDQPVDLLNVAFENPRAMRSRPNNESPYEICPDRITSRSSFDELLTICPSRNWRFVAIDMPYSQVQEHKQTIVDLMSPHNTEMDLSIAMALYFAARGEGHAITFSSPDAVPNPYKTPARVLISGLGADELFGGYSRHAAALSRSGYPGLIDELNLDFSRIGQRNLGRDDRVLSHWGKEVRYPYLDEDFTRLILDLPVWEKCGFRTGRVVPKHSDDVVKAERIEELDPSKMALRVLLWNLGMKRAASERKRAIQFGAKTAKMEMSSGRRKGTDVVLAD